MVFQTKGIKITKEIKNREGDKVTVTIIPGKFQELW